MIVKNIILALMKYTCEIEINKPIDKVVALFDNPDNMKKWMEGLESFEHLSGTPGQPGAKSKLKFNMGKRTMEMIETVTSRNLPEEFSGTYEAPGMFSFTRNRFVPIDPEKTRYVTEQEFRLKGFLKVMGILMPGAFKKQSMKHLVSFKTFVEKS